MKSKNKNACRLFATPRWRQWLLAATFFAFLSVFTTALTHLHEDQAQGQDCPICHVVGHQALDSHSPSLQLGIAVLIYLILSLPLLSDGRLGASFPRRPFSHAPPTRSR